MTCSQPSLERVSATPFQARWRGFWCFREAFMKKALAMIERAVSFTVTGSGAGDAPAPFFRLKAACCGRCNQMLQSVAGRTHCCILCRKCRQHTWDVAT